jgi:hypothetical protein
LPPASSTSPDADRRRCLRLIASRTPGRRRYQEYREDAEIYVEAHRTQPLALSGEGVVATNMQLSLRRSVLFERDYLIAWVDPGWLQQVAPGCDAIASVLQPILAFTPPPLVIVPSNLRRSRSEKFVSILEHEIVHINQALCSVFRADAPASSVDDFLGNFYQHMIVEFEANFVQGATWPASVVEHLRRFAMTLEHWSILRGHTQALERVLRHFATKGTLEPVISGFLAAVPRSAGERLRPLRLRKEMVSWFEGRWANDVLTALSILQEQGLDVVSSLAMQSVGRWLKAQPEIQAVLAEHEARRGTTR